MFVSLTCSLPLQFEKRLEDLDDLAACYYTQQAKDTQWLDRHSTKRTGHVGHSVTADDHAQRARRLQSLHDYDRSNRRPLSVTKPEFPALAETLDLLNMSEAEWQQTRLVLFPRLVDVIDIKWSLNCGPYTPSIDFRKLPAMQVGSVSRLYTFTFGSQFAFRLLRVGGMGRFLGALFEDGSLVTS